MFKNIVLSQNSVLMVFTGDENPLAFKTSLIKSCLYSVTGNKILRKISFIYLTYNKFNRLQRLLNVF